MSGKFYKLALWYIGKCNAKWDDLYKQKLETLDRLTYKNFGKYMLYYGADAEWQNFSRYCVLDNAIQKLAEYENAESKLEQESVREKEKIEMNKNNRPKLTHAGILWLTANKLNISECDYSDEEIMKINLAADMEAERRKIANSVKLQSLFDDYEI